MAQQLTSPQKQAWERLIYFLKGSTFSLLAFFFTKHYSATLGCTAMLCKKNHFAIPLFFEKHGDLDLRKLIDKTSYEKTDRLDKLDPARYWVNVMKKCLQVDPRERPEAHQLVAIARKRSPTNTPSHDVIYNK